MAKWQIGMYFFAEDGNLPDVSEDGWQPPALVGIQIITAHDVLSRYFGGPWNIAENWYVFGPECGNRVDVIFEAPSRAAIVMRFDARNDSAQFLELGCRLARDLGCQLFSPELNAVIQPDRLPLRMALGDIHDYIAHSHI